MLLKRRTNENRIAIVHESATIYRYTVILFYGQYPILRCRAYLYCHLCIVAMWIEWLSVVKCQHEKIPSYFISRTFRVDEKMPALYSTDALSWIVIVTAQWKCSKRELDQFCIQTNSEYAWFHLSCFHRRRRNVEKLTEKCWSEYNVHQVQNCISSIFT